jgi:hypothetical protein
MGRQILPKLFPHHCFIVGLVGMKEGGKAVSKMVRIWMRRNGSMVLWIGPSISSLFSKLIEQKT